MQAETLQAFLPEAISRPKMPARGCSSSMSRAWLRAGRCATSCDRLQPQDRVLLIGDIRQHRSVEAGRIFEELQHAGMKRRRSARSFAER